MAYRQQYQKDGVSYVLSKNEALDNVTGLVGLMVGSGLMGLYLTYLTKKTNTLWWSIVAHSLGGMIMIA